MSKEETKPQEVKLTPEQIAEIKKKQLAFFQDQLPLLQKQLEFEQCKSNIELARFQGLEAKVKFIQLSASLKKSSLDYEDTK